MFDSFIQLCEYFKKGKIETINKGLNKAIKNYHFLSFSKQNDFDHYNLMNQNIKESKVIIINQYINKSNNEQAFIICFEKMLILIDQSLLSSLYNFFFDNSELPIYFLSDAKETFKNNIIIQNKQIELKLDTTTDFNEEFLALYNQLSITPKCYHSINQIWKFVNACISTYIIKQIYAKTNEKQKFFLSNKNDENQILNKNDYIILRLLGTGSYHKVELIYHIDKEELFALKTPKTNENKLIQREISNYSSLNYPLLPKFYGIENDKERDKIIIQFIDGKLLSNIGKRFLDPIEKVYLNDDEKIIIIFELIMIFNYLHKNNFVYRDLKPDNVLIDENKNIFVIDFDRMIKCTGEKSSEASTVDFGSSFIAPEVNSGVISYKNDIYSIGQMIYFIMNEVNPGYQRNRTIKMNNDYHINIQRIYEKCTKANINERPTVSDLMFEFYLFFQSKIKSPLILNDPDVKYFNGIMDYKDEYIKCDINKTIHYLKIGVDQNIAECKNSLGIIYYENKYIKRDINKSIYYFTLASNQNIKQSQFILGSIYFEGKYIARDMKKAIYYLLLASNHKIIRAQDCINDTFNLFDNELQIMYSDLPYYLSIINQKFPQYQLGFNFPDISPLLKDLHQIFNQYFDDSYCNQYSLNALFVLGFIYFYGIYITRDIHKSIYYLTLAANKNHPQSQNILGYIYIEGKYIKSDINKAIHYFTLSANQNMADSQTNLGILYYYGKYIKRDVNKSLYFLSLAIHQNYSRAELNLGIIYIYGTYIQKNINKGIHYLSLAAYHKNPNAQYLLGIAYINGYLVEKKVKKGFNYLIQSLSGEEYLNEPFNAHFKVGYFYHRGKYVKRDIVKSIHHYKEASSFNDQYAKNNLGIIYKYGFGDEVPKNIGYAIEYFDEAIKQKNDTISKYNLAHLYIYEENICDGIDKSIELLIQSTPQNFFPNLMLLCIALIKKHGFNNEKIKKGILEKTNQDDSIQLEVGQMIIKYRLFNNLIFELFYHNFKEIDYLYDYNNDVILSSKIYGNGNNQSKYSNCQNITPDFYDGFGINL